MLFLTARYKNFIVGVLGLTLVLILWGFSTPMVAGPDDDFHVQSAMCAHGDREGICIKSRTSSFFYVPSAVTYAYECQVKTGPSCLSRELLNEHVAMLPVARVNQGMNFYPSIYYYVHGLLVNNNYESSIIKMRMLNVFIFITLFTATYFAVSSRLKRVLVGTIALFATPLTLWIAASNNPTSWAVIGSLVYSVNFLNLCQENSYRSKNMILNLGLMTLSTVIAVGARSDAAIGLMLVTGMWFLSQGLKNYRLHFGFIARCVLAINLVYMTICLVTVRQSGMLIDVSSKVDNGNSALNAIRNLASLPNLFLGNLSISISSISLDSWRFLGGVSRLNVGIPSVVGLFYGTLLLGALIGGIRTMDEASKLVIKAMVAVVFLGPLWLLQVNHSEIGDLVQPRYLLPILIVCVATVFFSWDMDYMPIRLKRFSYIFFASAANTIGIGAVIEHYLSDQDGIESRASEIYWSSSFAPSAQTIILLTLCSSLIWYNSCYTELSPKATADD